MKGIKLRFLISIIQCGTAKWNKFDKTNKGERVGKNAWTRRFVFLDAHFKKKSKYIGCVM